MVISSKLKEAVKEFCAGCTAHGLANIAKTESILFLIIWIIALSAATAASVFFTYTSFSAYFAYDTVVNYQVKIESEAEFPSITICNLNAFDPATYANTSEYIKLKLQESNIPSDIEVNDTEFAINKTNLYSTLLKSIVMSERNFSTYNLTKEQIGFTLETMLISCFFNNIQCDVSDFKWSYNFEFGNCYTFNNKNHPVRKTKVSGPNSGLVLELFVGKEDVQDFFSEKSGVFVHVHNTSTEQHVKYGGVAVQVGTATNIEISRLFYSKLDSPYSDCKSNFTSPDITSNYIKIINSLNTSYSQKLCFDLFIQIELVDKNCHCFHPSLPFPTDGNDKICNNVKDLLCGQNQITFANKTPTSSDCPMECDKIDYILNTNSAFYPNKFYSKILSSKTSVRNKFNPQYRFEPNNPSIFVPSITDGKIRANLETSKYSTNSIVTSTSITNNATTNTTKYYAITSVMNFTNITNNATINTCSCTCSCEKNSNVLTENNTLNGGPPSRDELSRSCLKVSIYYKDLTYILIEENAAVTWVTLLGTVGGQFGLFIGASFLTVLVFVELIYTLFWILKDSSLKKKINSLIKPNFDLSTE